MTRIRQLCINAFGLFRGLNLDLGTGLNIFLGRNEAGKSTMLAFIRRMIYGFATRGGENDYQPLNGGTLGGKLVVEKADGSCWTLERIGASKKKPPRLWNDRGEEEIGEEAVQRLFGNLPAEVYGNVVAFSLNELQDSRTLQKEQVHSVIYGAVAAVDPRALERLQGLLASAKGRGEGTPKKCLGVALNRITELQNKIRDASQQVRRYDEIVREIGQLDLRVREGQAELKRVSAELQKVRRRAEVWGAWCGLGPQEDKLRGVPKVDGVTFDGKARLEVLEGAISSFVAERKTQASGLDGLRDDLKKLPVDEILLGQGSSIDRFGRERAAYDDNLEAIQNADGAIAALQDECREALAKIGKEWDEGRAASIDVSEVKREDIREFERQLKEVADAEKAAIAEVERHRGEIRDLEERRDSFLRDANELRKNRRLPEADLERKLRDGRPIYLQHMTDLERSKLEYERLRNSGSDVGSADVLRRLINAAGEVRDLSDQLRDVETLERQLRNDLPPPEDAAALETRKKAFQTYRANAWILRLNWLWVLLAFASAAALASVAVGKYGYTALSAVLVMLACYGLAVRRRRIAGFRAAAVTLGLDGRCFDPALDQIEEEVDRARHAVEQRQIIQGRMGELLSERSGLRDKWRALALSLGVEPARTPADVEQQIDAAREQSVLLGQMEHAESSVRDLERQLKEFESLAVLFVPKGGDVAAEVATLLATCDEVAQKSNAASETDKEREGKERRHRELQVKADVVVQQHEAITSTWNEWLEKEGLPSSMSPQGALETLRHIGDVRSRLRLLEVERRKRVPSVKQVSEFLEQVGGTLQALGRERVGPEDVVAVADRLIEELKTSRENRIKREELEKQIQDRQKRIEGLDGQLEEERRKLAELLQLAVAKDSEDFRKIADTQNERRALAQQVEEVRNRIIAGLGMRSFEDARHELEGETRASLDTQTQELGDREEGLSKGLDGWNTEKGTLEGELMQLVSSDGVVDLQRQVGELVAQADAAAREWAVLALASDVFEKAKKKYNEEMQPGILKQAGAYLSLFTKDRYTSILMPVGKDAIEVVENGGASKMPSLLSRGTLEQLFLALRFGYIRELEGKGSVPPAVMDDILVNFDAEREVAAARAIIELSKAHQVLYFTCHPETASRFATLDGQAKVWTIGTDGNVRHRARGDTLEV